MLNGIGFEVTVEREGFAEEKISIEEYTLRIYIPSEPIDLSVIDFSREFEFTGLYRAPNGGLFYAYFPRVLVTNVSQDFIEANLAAHEKHQHFIFFKEGALGLKQGGSECRLLPEGV